MKPVIDSPALPRTTDEARKLYRELRDSNMHIAADALRKEWHFWHGEWL